MENEKQIYYPRTWIVEPKDGHVELSPIEILERVQREFPAARVDRETGVARVRGMEAWALSATAGPLRDAMVAEIRKRIHDAAEVELDGGVGFLVGEGSQLSVRVEDEEAERAALPVIRRLGECLAYAFWVSED